MKKQFKDALHRYKVEAFKLSHHGAAAQEVSREILEHTSQALDNAYHFHLPKNADPRRVETFQLIKAVTLETLLPPVIEKVMRRITILEHQNVQLVKLLDELLELLSADEQQQGHKSASMR